MFKTKYYSCEPVNEENKKRALGALFESEMTRIPESVRRKYMRHFCPIEKTVEFIHIKDLLDKNIEICEYADKCQVNLIEGIMGITTPVIEGILLNYDTDPRCLILSQLMEKAIAANFIQKNTYILTLVTYLIGMSNHEIVTLLFQKETNEFKTAFEKFFSKNELDIPKDEEFIYKQICIFHFLYDQIELDLVEKLTGNTVKISENIMSIIKSNINLKYIIDISFGMNEYVFLNTLSENIEEFYNVNSEIPINTTLEYNQDGDFITKNGVLINYEEHDFSIDDLRFILQNLKNIDTFFCDNTLKINSSVYNNQIWAFDKKNKIFIKGQKNYTASAFKRYELLIEYQISKILEETFYKHEFVKRSICTSICSLENWVLSEEKSSFTRTQNRRKFVSALVFPRIQGKEMITLKNKISNKVTRWIILHVFCVLNEMSKELNFTHYDLHLGNIFLCNPNNDFVNNEYFEELIQDIINSKSYYLDENLKIKLPLYDVFYPVIFDFGRSRVQVEEKYIGGIFSQKERKFLGIYPEKSYPAADIFKICCLLYVFSNKDPIYEECLKELFNYTFVQADKIWDAISYNTQYNKKFEHITYEDFIRLFYSKIFN